MENVKIVEKKKKTILVLCDHPLSTSGVGTQARYLLTGLLDTGEYRIKCFGAAVKHADYKTVSVPPTSAAWEPGDFIIKPIDGFGDTNMMRQVLATEKPDALFIFTDPRFFIWLWEMEEEIHQVCPIVYWHVWDNLPWPEFNRVLYESTDLINCHSYLTYKMVHEHFPEKTNFIPHAVPQEIFHPLSPTVVADFKKRLLPPDRQDHFVSFWINRNAKRKRSNDLLEAWKLFMDMLEKKHGHRKATLLMHTDPFDQAGSNLVATSEMLGIQNDVIFSKDRILFEDVAVMHNISDVVVNISCFPAKTKVVSEKGFQDIETIEPGDSVLTHMGRYMPVVRKYERQYSGKLYTIHVSNADTLSMTEEHPIRVIRREHANSLPGRNIKSMIEHAEWIRVSDVCVGDYVVDCVEKIDSVNAYEFNVWDSVKDESFEHFNKTRMKYRCENGKIKYNCALSIDEFAAHENIKLDEDFAYVLGEWIADDSTHSMSVSFNKLDADLAETLRQKYERVFGQTAYIKEFDRHLEVNLKNPAVYSAFITDVCGEYSEGKRIPRAILSSNESIKRAFLAGYQAGDGCVLFHKQHATYVNRVRTISNGLAVDMKQLLVSLGYCPQIHDDDNSHGYNKNGRIWTIEWRDRRHAEGSNGSCRTWNVGNLIIARIFEIDVDDVECKVFNLEVEKDNSYATKTCLAHNCNEGFGLGTLEAMQCGTPIIALKTGGLTRQVVDHRDGSENGIALPVEVQTLVGSQLCPYIYEDYCSNQTIADALLKMFDMGNEERERLGEKARQYVLSEFSLSKTVADWHTTLSTTIETWKSNKASIYRPVEIVKL